jgi:hypothetical protein
MEPQVPSRSLASPLCERLSSLLWGQICAGIGNRLKRLDLRFSGSCHRLCGAALQRRAEAPADALWCVCAGGLWRARAALERRPTLPLII